MLAVHRLRVVVVGGGTAGWMTAAALSKLLPGRCTVDLVESEEIGIVGVGEATLPHIRGFNERLGIDEADFMSATKATFKLGIDFENWGRIGDRYIHPFGTFGRGQGEVDFHQYWLRIRHDGVAVPDLEQYSMACMMARLASSTCRRRTGDVASTFSYAYQFDATLYAPYLGRAPKGSAPAHRGQDRRRRLERRKRRRRSGRPRETGSASPATCSSTAPGFVSLLIGKALEEPFEDWSKWLPCDRAVGDAVPDRNRDHALHRSHRDGLGLALANPLQHRTGNGYVYSSAFVSDERGPFRPRRRGRGRADCGAPGAELQGRAASAKLGEELRGRGPCERLPRAAGVDQHLFDPGGDHGAGRAVPGQRPIADSRPRRVQPPGRPRI